MFHIGTNAQALARAVASPEPQADARPDAQAFPRAHAPTFAGADDRAHDGTDAAPQCSAQPGTDERVPRVRRADHLGPRPVWKSKFYDASQDGRDMT